MEAAASKQRAVQQRQVPYPIPLLPIVGPALLFGILIAEAVRTFVSPDRLVRAPALVASVGGLLAG